MGEPEIWSAKIPKNDSQWLEEYCVREDISKSEAIRQIVHERRMREQLEDDDIFRARQATTLVDVVTLAAVVSTLLLVAGMVI